MFTKVSFLILALALVVLSNSTTITVTVTVKGNVKVAKTAVKAAIKKAVQQIAKKATQPIQKININSASAQLLVSIKGVGPSTAKKIVAYRLKHGNFQRISSLLKVNGIGKKKLVKMVPSVTLN